MPAATESVAAFVTELRALAKHCNYHADSLDSLLRDRLVCGINDASNGADADAVKADASNGDCC